MDIRAVGCSALGGLVLLLLLRRMLLGPYATPLGGSYGGS